jgi:O-antigen ligase
MNRERLDRWCERGILGLLLVVLVWGPLAFGCADPLEFVVLQGLTVGILLLWTVRLWLNGRAQLFWPPLCWAVAAFCLYAIARYLTSDIEYVARQEMIRVLVYGFLFFAMVNNLQRKEVPQIVSLTLVFLAMGISFYALWQFLTGTGRVWGVVTSYPHRGSGTFICPNNLAGFLEMILPLGLAYTVAGRNRAVTKVFLGYASLVIMAGLAVTVSRGGWISAAVALALFFGVLMFNRTYRLPSAVLLVALVAAGYFMYPKSVFVVNRTHETIAEGKVGDFGRMDVWESAFRMWQQHPWWGVGPAHFDYRFRAFRPALVQVRPEYAHNDYLNTLADWGLAGGVIVAAALVLLALGVAKTWDRVGDAPADLGGKQSSNRFAFVLGASLGLAALLCHSLVDFNMHIPANAILAVTLMALLTNHLRNVTGRWRISLGAAARVAASAILAGGMVYLGLQGARRAGETVWLRRAHHAPVFSPSQIESLKRAYAADPKNGQTAQAIGEAYRIESHEGGEGYEELAKQAIEWYRRSLQLNRWNDSSWLGYGWCLDWLGRHAEAEPCFQKAAEMDPNGYYTMDYVGLHYVELEDYAAARPFFERSHQLRWEGNLIATSYLEIVDRKLLAAATNSPGEPAGAGAR